jgi:PAS domain S-box-containing protein
LKVLVKRMVREDMIKNDRSAGATETRLRAGQKVVAELGRLEIQDVDLIVLMNKALELVTQTLGAPYGEVLELLPDEKILLMRAGVGWGKEMIGAARINASADSQAGYTLLVGEPVIAVNLWEEVRFIETEVFTKKAKLVSGITATIGDKSSPFGVLGVHAAAPHAFYYDDLNFLQAVANLLAAGYFRQQSREALKAVTWRMRNVLDNPDKVFFSINATSNTMLHVSLGCESLYGLPQQAFFKNINLWREIVHPDDRSAHEAQVALLGRGKTLSLQHRILRPDGEVRWVQSKIEPTLGSNGRLTRIDGAVSDVTKSIQVEQALHSSERDYQQLFDNINEVCYIIDREWRYKHLNRAATRVTRISKDNLIDQYVVDVSSMFSPASKIPSNSEFIKRRWQQGSPSSSPAATSYPVAHPTSLRFMFIPSRQASYVLHRTQPIETVPKPPSVSAGRWPKSCGIPPKRSTAFSIMKRCWTGSWRISAGWCLPR